MVFGSLALTACGDDDDSETPEQPTATSLAGTKWYDPVYMDGQIVSYEIWAFTESKIEAGTLMEMDGVWVKFVRHEFPYSVDGNKLTFQEQPGTYAISGDVLTINWSDGGSDAIKLQRLSGDMLKRYNNAKTYNPATGQIE